MLPKVECKPEIHPNKSWNIKRTTCHVSLILFWNCVSALTQTLFANKVWNLDSWFLEFQGAVFNMPKYINVVSLWSAWVSKKFAHKVDGEQTSNNSATPAGERVQKLQYEQSWVHLSHMPHIVCFCLVVWSVNLNLERRNWLKTPLGKFRVV